MKLTDLLLVTHNCQGQCEANFLSTIDEFIATWCFNENYDICDTLKKVILGAKPYNWDGFYAASNNHTFEMRLCQTEEDLLSFLSGKYNDSIEKLESRKPGTEGLYYAWNWFNSPEDCSVKAVEIIKEYVRANGRNGKEFSKKLFLVIPDLPFEKRSDNYRAKRLDEIISDAKSYKPINKSTISTSAARSSSLEP